MLDLYIEALSSSTGCNYNDTKTMIYNFTGSVFEAPANVIIHQCNCFHTMGTGIAKAIRERYPDVYKSDLKTDFADRKKLGTFNLTKIKDPRNRDLRFVCNLYSQYHYGKDKCHTNYEALETGLTAIEQQMSNPHVEVSLAVPWRIGSASSGGDWNKVQDIIKKVFLKSRCKLYICIRPEDAE